MRRDERAKRWSYMRVLSLCMLHRSLSLNALAFFLVDMEDKIHSERKGVLQFVLKLVSWICFTLEIKIWTFSINGRDCVTLSTVKSKSNVISGECRATTLDTSFSSRKELGEHADEATIGIFLKKTFSFCCFSFSGQAVGCWALKLCHLETKARSLLFVKSCKAFITVWALTQLSN